MISSDRRAQVDSRATPQHRVIIEFLRRARQARIVLVAALCLLATMTFAVPASAATRTFSGMGLTANGQGYLLVSTRGEFYAFGNATPQNNPSGFRGDIVDVAVTADGRGAMAVSSEGQFYAFGTARPQPNPTGFNGGIVAVAITADGQGTMAVSGQGQFYAYGTARPQPNPNGFSDGIVDVALTADGQGAMAVSGRGQFYAYGTARPEPNPTGFSGRITSMDLTADGQGAVAVSSAGQFYAYGSARPQQNPSNFTDGIVSVDLTADGQGLTAMSGSGQIYAYPTANHFGNDDPGSVAPPSASAAQLAQQVLDLRKAGKISFTDYSSDRARDSAERSLASQQMEDIAAGKPAQLSRRCSHSTPYTVQPDLQLMRFLADLGQQSQYKINVLFGQCHSATSLHYNGRAVDFGCGLDTGVATTLGKKYGIARNFETCNGDGHWHYSAGGR